MTTPVTVDLKADTPLSKALQLIVGLAGALRTRPGFKTSEFWVVLLSIPGVLSLLDTVFHRDFSPWVQFAAIVMAGLVSFGYALSRAHLKRPTNLGSLLDDLRAILEAGQQAEPVVQQAVAAVPKKKAPPKTP